MDKTNQILDFLNRLTFEDCCLTEKTDDKVGAWGATVMRIRREVEKITK
ncbi:MAG: hypothetical protein WC455_10325 [Dehalococcoidia bacterium]|jgi:hypothetical protein